MSSILKALKKLEDDKSTRRPDELKIDSEILRSDNSPRISSAGMILTSLLLLASGSGATYLYMKHDKPPEFVNPKMPAITMLNQHPVPPASDIKTEQLPEEVLVVPATQQNITKTGTVKLQQPPMSTRSEHAVAASKPARSVEQADSSISTSPSPSSASVRTVPALRVNGIASQDGMDSVAMVNGVQVSSGSVIDGVKIEEILKNVVRFSYNGERFEINLGQSNR